MSETLNEVGASTPTLVIEYSNDVIIPFCKPQELTNWCWAACVATCQNYLASFQSSNQITTPADVASWEYKIITNSVGDVQKVMEENGFAYAQETTMFAGTLENFLAFAYSKKLPIVLAKNPQAVDGHGTIIYGYGYSENSVLYLKEYDPSTNTEALVSSYDVIENCWVLVVYSGQNNNGENIAEYMNPVQDQLTGGTSGSKPYTWHVVNNEANSPQTVAKYITYDDITYTMQANKSGDNRGFYYVRMTIGSDPFGADTYYASKVKFKRKKHDSFSATLSFGEQFTDPHENMYISGTSAQSGLTTTAGTEPAQRSDFYVHLIPCAQT